MVLLQKGRNILGQLVPPPTLSMGAAPLLVLAKLIATRVGSSSEQFATSKSIGSSMQMSSTLISQYRQGPSK